MSNNIYVGREFFIVENEEAFAQIIESQMGPEAADLFRHYIGEAYQRGIDTVFDAANSLLEGGRP